MAQETPSWLNQEFTEGVLRRSEGDNSIQVIDISTKPATNKGDNYTSDMIRIYAEYSRKRPDGKTNEKTTMIVKILPPEVGIRRELIEKSQIFDTEISMMSSTLKKMNDLLGDGKRLNGRMLYVQDDPKLLVIEDLAALGFRMADRHSGLDLAHCILAIQGLARFHAASVALFEKEPNHWKKYQKGIFSTEQPKEMSQFFVAGTKALADEVRTWPELGEKYADKIERLSTCLFEKGIEAAKRKDGEFNVLNHGDSWVNNMLFKYDEHGKPIQHIFVDFQLSVYTTPAIDLLYFLSTSPSEKTMENGRQHLLDEYLRTLSSTMKRLNCKTQPPSMQQLQKSIKERSFFALVASFTVLPLVLLDKDKAVDLNELLPEGGTYDNVAYRGETYRRIISKRIRVYDEEGMLDV